MNVNRCQCGKFIRKGETQCDECLARLANFVGWFMIGAVMAELVMHPEKLDQMMEAINGSHDVPRA